MAMKKYTTAMKLDLGDGEEYAKGAEIEMDPKDAQQYIDDGTLVDPDAKPDKGEDAKPPPDKQKAGDKEK